MFSDDTPSSLRKPTQNWCVDQMLRTFGMPTRSCERSLTRTLLVAAEPFFANHVGNIRIGIFGFLDSRFDDFHFVQVFDQPLRAGVVDDDALPAVRERNLAPRPTLAFEQLNVDEAALAIDRAPVTHGIDRGGSFVSEQLDGIEPAKDCFAAVLPPVERNECRADSPSFTGVWVYYDFGLGHFRQDEINLRFYNREITVSSTLQNVFAPDLLQIVQAAGVDPHVKRENGAQAGENFFRLPSFALLVDDVAL